MNKNKFFRKSDWVAFFVTFFVSLTVYVLTLAPTVTLEDSGELAVASDYLGVPHPPGYPIWTLLTWFFQWVFHGVTYNGHPNPAWAVNLFSGVAGAAACGVIALLISRSGKDLLESLKTESQQISKQTEELFCSAAGISGGLLLAFAQGMWSQSVITEVYSLNIFFQSLILLFLYRWIKVPKGSIWMILCAFTFGLGTTNHQTLIFMGLAIAIAVLFRDFKLFRDFALAGIPLLIMVVINEQLSKAGSEWSWNSGWDHHGFWFWNAYALLIPTMAIFLLPNGKVVGLTVLAMETGMAFYLYMPFSSDQNPPINWGYPRTWEGFMHAITRGQYERVVLSDIFTNPGHFILQCRAFFNDLSAQFLLPIVMLGLLPFTAWKLKLFSRHFNGFLYAILLVIPAAILEAIQKIIQVYLPERTVDWVTYISGSLMFILLLMSGLGFGLVVVNFLEKIYKRCLEVYKEGGVWNWIEVIFTVGAVALAGLLCFRMGMKLTGAFIGTFPTNETWVNVALFGWITSLPLFLISATVLKYSQAKLQSDIDDDGQHWFIITIVAFVAVGLIFVVLQNPKMDIQTLFIGRVQYIQSHAIYSLWLGYGLLFTVTYIESFFHNNKPLRYTMAIALLILPSILLLKNKYDTTQEISVGGSEQNGHNFGWQFGNWELQGVDGIKEDLQAWYNKEEFETIWEDYPNKAYPPPMGTNAIFFGGTDPGRFVPTYMIYSAKVRQDVYLITQNALADNTYMEVMRDLYGDQIWIPGPRDSNLAFQEYVQGVRSGKFSAGGNLNTEGGKVQVQGVAGVMKINGFLSKMIFDNNQYITEGKTDETTRPVGAAVVHQDPIINQETGLPPQRTFYVEESYVLDWMYPYLTPHGLIMKINNKPTPLTKENIKNDTDFWNWYCERLLNDENFIRDTVARKTFSKLRTALAGLYTAKGKLKEAEAAFRQAVQLYDLSPEASFRLADLLTRENRYEEAIETMNAFLEKDKNNDKAKAFRDQLISLSQLNAERIAIQKKIESGTTDFNTAISLLHIYIRMNKLREADNLAYKLITYPHMNGDMLLQLTLNLVQARRYAVTQVALNKYKPVLNNQKHYKILYEIAKKVAAAREFKLTETALQKACEINPNNWAAWVNLAAFQIPLDKTADMLTSVQNAVHCGSNNAVNAIRKDKRFNTVRNLPAFKKIIPSRNNNTLLNIPGL